PAPSVVERHTPVRVRLDLHQRAATNLRRHALRAVRRFMVLVVADLASFFVMRELVRTLRDYAWFGERVAAGLGSVLPAGILNGWQYAAALFVGPAEECREAMKSQAFAGAEYRSVGFVDSHIPPAPESRGQISDFPRLLHDANAEAVVVCGYLSDTRFGDVVDAALAAQCQL